MKLSLLKGKLCTKKELAAAATLSVWTAQACEPQQLNDVAVTRYLRRQYGSGRLRPLFGKAINSEAEYQTRIQLFVRTCDAGSPAHYVNYANRERYNLEIAPN